MRDFPKSVSLVQLEKRLAEMPEPFATILNPHALRAAERGVFWEEETGTLFVGNRPEAGTFNFVLSLGPPVSNEYLREYEKVTGVSLPKPASELLAAFNGASFYEMNLYAANLDSYRNSSPFSRNFHRYSDIGFVYSICTRGVHGRDGRTVFASRNSSLDQVEEYLSDDDGKICGLNVHGDRSLIGHWDSVGEWLTDRIKVAAEFSAEWCRACAQMLRGAQKKRSRARRITIDKSI